MFLLVEADRCEYVNLTSQVDPFLRVKVKKFEGFQSTKEKKDQFDGFRSTEKMRNGISREQ